MNLASLGDLAQSNLFQRRSVELRSELTRLAGELSSGRVADVSTVLNGNYSYLSDLERSLRISDGYGVALAEATQFATGVQLALEQARTAGQDLSNSLINITDAPLWSALDQGADIAEGALNQIVAALNTDMAGRNLFSGNATDARPLVNADELIDMVSAAVAGQTGAVDIRAAAEAWFDDPAGFETMAYMGSDTELAAFQVLGDESVNINVMATDPAIKDLLLNTAIAAIATDPGLALEPGDMAALYREAGTNLIVNSEQVVGLQGKVGAVEERLENLTLRNDSEALAIEFARNRLLEADPFETATELETVQFQLESLYTITARVSGLSLVNFI